MTASWNVLPKYSVSDNLTIDVLYWRLESKPSKKEDKTIQQIKTTERQSSLPHERNKKNIIRQISHGSSTIAKKVEELSLTADLHLKPSSSWFGKNSKRIPEPEFGFLVQVR
jgi:hypothetical protein